MSGRGGELLPTQSLLRLPEIMARASFSLLAGRGAGKAALAACTQPQRWAARGKNAGVGGGGARKPHHLVGLMSMSRQSGEGGEGSRRAGHRGTRRAEPPCGGTVPGGQEGRPRLRTCSTIMVRIKSAAPPAVRRRLIRGGRDTSSTASLRGGKTSVTARMKKAAGARGVRGVPFRRGEQAWGGCRGGEADSAPAGDVSERRSQRGGG